MSIPQRPVTGVFSFDSIVEQFPDWVKDACTAFFINAMYPLQSSPGNDDLYVLLTDIAQEVRVADQGQVDRRCMPYRAEVKQHVGNLRDAFIVHNSPDWLRDACAAFFVASEVLARAAPLNDATFMIQDVAYKELNERTDKLYLLLMDIVHQVRDADPKRAREASVPYRAEVKQLITRLEVLAVRRQQQKV